MKKYILFFLILALLLCGTAVFCQEKYQSSKPSISQNSLESKATELVNLLANEDFSNATKNFDDKMKKLLPSEKLREVWISTIKEIGLFKKQVDLKTEKLKKDTVIIISCECEKYYLDIRVFFNDQGEISGLFFVPVNSTFKYEPPKYVNQNSFKEKNVVIGAGEWKLRGILTLPLKSSPFPAVVLVHGSGANDMDESLGPNKIFKDIAWGLASKGIAVLRYNKRNFEHALKSLELSESMTVKKETIEDALLAVSYLRETTEINSKKNFILGHSLGGMLIPKIANLDMNIAGFIIMAGSARPLEDVILEQYEYIFSLDGVITEDEKKYLELVEKQVDKVKDPNLSEKVSSKELPIGIPAKYWLDLRGYNPPEAASTINKPVLILQGERDYQTTIKDFELWKKYLALKKNVQFNLYQKLNHEFVEGTGKSAPQEYNIPCHVSESVINDIADWIIKN